MSNLNDLRKQADRIAQQIAQAEAEERKAAVQEGRAGVIQTWDPATTLQRYQALEAQRRDLDFEIAPYVTAAYRGLLALGDFVEVVDEDESNYAGWKLLLTFHLGAADLVRFYRLSHWLKVVGLRLEHTGRNSRDSLAILVDTLDNEVAKIAYWDEADGSIGLTCTEVVLRWIEAYLEGGN